MDKAVLIAKLGALRRCLERIQAKTPATALELVEDYDRQDIIAVNLERAIQQCVDIAAHILADLDRPAPESMAGAFEALGELGVLSKPLADHLKRSVGFRNISVHAYQDIDWNVVYSIVTTRLEDFPEFIRQINTRFKLW